MFAAHEYFINVNMVISVLAALLVLFALSRPRRSFLRSPSLILAGSLLVAVNLLHLLILYDIRLQLMTATMGDVPLGMMTRVFLSAIVMSLALAIGFGLMLWSVAGKRI